MPELLEHAGLKQEIQDPGGGNSWQLSNLWNVSMGRTGGRRNVIVNLKAVLHSEGEIGFG